MWVKRLRALIALSIVLCVSSSYAHNKVVVVTLGGDDAPPPTVYAIGDTGPAGGVVFYVTNGGLHGLEAAPADLAPAVWGCKGTFSGGGGTAIGTGIANTASDITVSCGSTETRAVQRVRRYQLNGFFDWYLPSKDELNELNSRKDVVGGFVSDDYWSSSEMNSNVAWFQFFPNGEQALVDKTLKLGVRAIRSF